MNAHQDYARRKSDLFHSWNDPITPFKYPTLYKGDHTHEDMYVAHLLLPLVFTLVFTAHTSDSDLTVEGALVRTKTRPPKDSLLQVTLAPEALHLPL